MPQRQILRQRSLGHSATKHGLKAFAISNHLVGQAVCDLIDERHKLILPPDVYGDGEPEGVRKRAAKKMIDTAKACRKFIDAAPKDNGFPAVVNGFTGSSIWHSIYAFPPTDQKYWQKAGFDDFASCWTPILNEFEKTERQFRVGSPSHRDRLRHCLHPVRALEAIKHHKRFGFNYDPSHLGYQHVDYVKFIRAFKDRIYHVHIKDAWWGHGDGTVGVFGGHATFADARRYWDFRSPGHGDINFEDIIVALNDINYQGPLSASNGKTPAEWTANTMRAGWKPRSLCGSWTVSNRAAIAFDVQFDR